MLLANLCRRGLLALAVACLAACGGNPQLRLDSAFLAGGGEMDAQRPMPRRQVNYDFNLGRFPTARGLTLVSLAAQDRELPAAAGHLNIAVQPVGPELEATLTVDGGYRFDDRLLQACLRYDPAQWEVAGVGSTNVWGTEHFAALTDVPQPGVLLLASCPGGQAAYEQPRGVFATVRLRPARGGRQASSTLTNNATIKTCWYASGGTTAPLGTPSRGTLQYASDGAIGNAGSKNGALGDTGDLIQSVDNLHYEAELDNFGATYDGTTFPSLTLTFSEQLNGDYNNDGYVSINDLSPIGGLMTLDSTPDYISPRRANETGTWNVMLDLYAFLQSNWHTGTSNDLTVFWYAGIANSATLNGRTRSALDGNWDGIAWDYANWDKDGLEGPESVWDETVSGEVYIHVGDAAPIKEHLNEQLDGYRVKTVGPDSEVTVVRTYIRDRPVTSGPGTMYIDGDQSTPVWPYDEQPWLEPGDGDNTLEEEDFHRFRKAQFELELTHADFGLTPENGSYNVVIEPFVLDVLSGVTTPGPISELQGALVVAKPEPPVDDEFGPVYRPDTSVTTPDFTPTVSDTGIVSAAQGVGADNYNYTLTIVNADDVDKNGTAFAPEITVLYDIYAYSNVANDGSTPPSAGTMFTSGNIIDTVPEGPLTGTTFKTFEVDVDVPCGKRVDDKDAKVWFGVRARAVLDEYDDPLDQYSPNNRLIGVEVDDNLQPFFVQTDRMQDQACPTTGVGLSFYRPEHTRYRDGIKVRFWPAIDGPEYDPHTEITYSLYVSASTFSSVSGMTPKSSRNLSHSDLWDSGKPVTNQDALLSFIIYQHPLTNAQLGYDETVYACVVASKSGLQSQPQQARAFTTLPEPAVFEELETYNTEVPGTVRGALETHNEVLYMVYPHGGSSDPVSNPNLNFEVRAPLTAKDRLDPEFLPTNREAISASSQVGLSFKRDETGALVEMSGNSGVLDPIVSYSGADGFNGELITGWRGSTGTWSFHEHDQNSAPSQEGVDGLQLESYAYKQVFSVGSAWVASDVGRYFLPFVHADGIVTWGGSEDPFGILYAKSRPTSISGSNYGFWNSDTSLPDGEQFQFSSAGTFEAMGFTHTGTDTITRQLGRISTQPTIGPFASGVPPSYGNRLYLLTSSPHDNSNHELLDYGPRYQWHNVKLWRSTTLASNDWEVTDMMVQLDAADDNSVSIGPNALEALRETPTANSSAFIYVTYVNSQLWNTSSSDNLGLRICSAVEPVGGGPLTFTSDDSFGLIDTAYTWPMNTGTGQPTDGTSAQIDLRALPSAFTEGASRYEQLGCVYTADSVLYLSESQPGGGWQAREISEGITAIDGGDILWVKLAYIDDATPVVMYCVNDSVFSTGYAIRLWPSGL
jgi:hypothetical protein